MALPPQIVRLDDGKVEISTSRLLLRAAREDDVNGLHNAFSDSEVMRYWSTPPHISCEETSTWISKMTTSAQNGTTDFVIALPSGSAIGKIGIWQDQEIGFLLSQEYWGKGLAREALCAILEYLFREIDLHEITADVDPRNQRSMTLLENVGFVKTGFKERTWEVGGKWVDSVYFGLSMAVWEESQGGKP